MMRARKNHLTVLGVAVSALLALMLAGCAPAVNEAVPAASAPNTPEVAATSATPPCSTLTSLEALKTSADEVETPRPWDLDGEYSDVSGYDPCADISWIVLRPASCCTVFEITPVLFFHRGELVPEATVLDRAQDRQTAAERLSDDAITLTFATPGGANKPPKLTTTTYSWDETTAAVVAVDAVADEPPAAGGSIDGHWCPTPESTFDNGCVTIAFPTATFADGRVEELTDLGDQYGDGGVSYMVPGAPFGTFYPAGTPIQLPDYYAGTDLPDQDRIWNGQTSVMLVRG